MSTLYFLRNLNQTDHEEIHSIDRYAHTMTRVTLKNEDFLLIYGGILNSETKKYSIHFTEEILLFHIKNKKWCKVLFKGERPQERHFHSGSFYNGKLYIFGGKKNGFESLLNDFYVLDLENFNWKQLVCMNSELIKERHGHTSHIYKDKLYIYGSTNSVDEYDLKKKQWKIYQSKKKDLQPRSFHSSSILNDKMYVFGGTDQLKIFNDLWEFDLKSKTWKEIKLKEMISPRCGHLSLTAQKEELIIFGGLSDKELPHEVLLFNGQHFRSVDFQSIFTNFDNEDSIDLIPGLIHTSAVIEDSNIYLFGGKMELETNVDDSNEFIKKSNCFLSTDELVHVYTFLEYKDVLSLSLVCSEFYDASNSNFLWNQMYKINHAVDIPAGNGKENYFKKHRLDRNWFFHEPKIDMINMDSGVTLLKFKQKNVLKDGSGILAAGLANGEVSLMKMNDKKITKHLSLKSTEKEVIDVVYCLNFNQRRMGSHLISAGNGKIITMFDMETGELIDAFDSQQTRGIWNIDMLDSTTIISGSDDRTMKLFDIHTHKLLISYDEHKGPVYDFATNEDGPSSDIIISASYDSTCILWDRRAEKSQGKIQNETQNFEINLFNTNTLTVGGYSLVSLYDMRMFGKLIDSHNPFQKEALPVRGLSVNSTRTVCGSRNELSIFTRQNEILKLNSVLNNTKCVLDKFETIQRLEQKKILSLHSDDELLITGTTNCEIFISDFAVGNPKIFEKSKTKDKNCAIQ
eukprot:gene6369-10376_t